MTEPETRTLDAPGAVLSYDVRSNDASTQPVLLLIGSSIGAGGFVTQAGHFTDRMVVTYDPRGAGRSKRTDGASETMVEEQAGSWAFVLLQVNETSLLSAMLADLWGGWHNTTMPFCRWQALTCRCAETGGPYGGGHAASRGGAALRGQAGEGAVRPASCPC
jgi:hypothetical protein